MLELISGRPVSPYNVALITAALISFKYFVHHYYYNVRNDSDSCMCRELAVELGFR